jgi:hypothetical protein
MVLDVALRTYTFRLFGRDIMRLIHGPYQGVIPSMGRSVSYGHSITIERKRTTVPQGRQYSVRGIA